MAVIVVSTKTKNTFLSQKCGNGIISFFSENLQNNNSSVDILETANLVYFSAYIIRLLYKVTDFEEPIPLLS